MAKSQDKSAPKSGESSGPLTHKEIMIVLSGLMTGMLLAALDQTIVSTALKNIVEDFNGLTLFHHVSEVSIKVTLVRFGDFLQLQVLY